MTEPVSSHTHAPKIAPVVAPRRIPLDPPKNAPLIEPDSPPASARIINNIITVAPSFHWVIVRGNKGEEFCPPNFVDSDPCGYLLCKSQANCGFKQYTTIVAPMVRAKWRRTTCVGWRSEFRPRRKLNRKEHKNDDFSLLCSLRQIILYLCP